MARRNELGKIRRSQVITTWGPGAIIDFRAGGDGGAPVSVVAAGLDEWDNSAGPAGMLHPQTITEPRLQARLRVDGFRLPPVEPEGQTFHGGVVRGSLIGVRFPKWLQCPECHLLKRDSEWKEQPGDPVLTCPSCSTKHKKRVAVVPVRFIVACDHGHLDEFPWHFWVNHKIKDCRGPLELRSTGGSGLAGLRLSCRTCQAAQSLAGVFGRGALGNLGCRGKKPWLGTPDDVGCTREPRVLQRGASNLYFSLVLSALDVPPWSDRVQHALGVVWPMLVDAPPDERKVILKRAKVAELLKMPLEDIEKEVDARLQRLLQTDSSSLRWEEYERFVSDEKIPIDYPGEFEVKPELVPPALKGFVGRIVRATRLREVRVLRGFSRIYPPMDDRPTSGNGPKIAPLSAARLPWLPAIEVRGEGIFLELDHGALAKWEDHSTVKARAAQVDAAYREMWKKRFSADEPPPRTIQPRLLLAHSLAHVLMRQLSLTCGYPSTSLRERLYVDTGKHAMCSVLIYTATPDSEGTLGGLVRQGKGRLLTPLLEQAIASAQWCSSDPLCIQGAHALSEPQNLAACHACLLASETSCEEFNVLLDRAMLVGTPEDPTVGFFNGLLGR